MPYAQQIIHDYFLLFAMINAVGNLPIFADMTRDLDRQSRRHTFRIAVTTACAIVIGFAFFGEWMLRTVFQVDIGAFKVAGGLLVFAVAARGVLAGPQSPGKSEQHYASMAVFPLGFPFLAGPGTIVTTILLMQAGGRWITAAAAILAYATVSLILPLVGVVERVVGRLAMLVMTRILFIFICAKAVAFVLDGLKASFSQF